MISICAKLSCIQKLIHPMWLKGERPKKVVKTLKAYLLTPPLSSPQAKELFLLPGDKINPGIFEQCSKYKEQTHSHPDIDGLHIRDLKE